MSLDKERIKVGILVLIITTAIILTFIFIPEYEEGQIIEEVKSVDRCNDVCPNNCDCFYRSGKCFINKAC